MTWKYADPRTEQVFCRIAETIDTRSRWDSELESMLIELAQENSPSVARYWARTEVGRGIPDRAFRQGALYWFEDQVPARTFKTSGTTGAQSRGEAHYSPRGLELLRQTIVGHARQHVTPGLESPVILRLVPDERAVPDMIMAYGMGVIASELGDPENSAVVVGPTGVDFDLLAERLDRAVAADQPVVLIGGSFVFVNVCDYLEGIGRSWRLPAGSRMIDAGGFKGRSRELDVDTLRAAVGRVFGIEASGCVNLFGMTELASQLYDGSDVALGPLAERPKGGSAFVEPRVRDSQTMGYIQDGSGLLEVADLCILDRPYVVLTGDLAIASPHGVAIIGRAERGQTRGCSLSLDSLTRKEVA